MSILISLLGVLCALCARLISLAPDITTPANVKLCESPSKAGGLTVINYLLPSRSTNGNDPNLFSPIGNKCRPMFLPNLTYDNRSGLILCFGWDFQTIRIVPENLRLDKADAMFLPVSFAFKWVKLKIRNGIINIPLWQIGSTGDLPIERLG